MGRTLPAMGQFLNLPANNLVLSAFKRSEDSSNQWVIRCYESHGQSATIEWTSGLGAILSQRLNAKTVKSTNLLERPIAQALGTIAPWKIATFAIGES